MSDSPLTLCHHRRGPHTVLGGPPGGWTRVGERLSKELRAGRDRTRDLWRGRYWGAGSKPVDRGERSRNGPENDTRGKRAGCLHESR